MFFEINLPIRPLQDCKLLLPLSNSSILLMVLILGMIIRTILIGGGTRYDFIIDEYPMIFAPTGFSFPMVCLNVSRGASPASTI